MQLTAVARSGACALWRSRKNERSSPGASRKSVELTLKSRRRRQRIRLPGGISETSRRLRHSGRPRGTRPRGWSVGLMTDEVAVGPYVRRPGPRPGWISTDHFEPEPRTGFCRVKTHVAHNCRRRCLRLVESVADGGAEADRRTGTAAASGWDRIASPSCCSSRPSEVRQWHEIYLNGTRAICS